MALSMACGLRNWCEWKATASASQLLPHMTARLFRVHRQAIGIECRLLAFGPFKFVMEGMLDRLAAPDIDPAAMSAQPEIDDVAIPSRHSHFQLWKYCDQNQNCPDDSEYAQQ